MAPESCSSPSSAHWARYLKSATDEIVRLAPHVKVVQIEGPHLLLQCAPKACAAVLRDFVTQKNGAVAGPT